MSALKREAGYCAVWEFIVRPDRAEQFATAYGPDGAWAQLFARSSGFLRTELLQDRSLPGRFLTLDYWTERSAFQEFKDRFGEEYRALDERFEGWTDHETLVGEFTPTGAGAIAPRRAIPDRP